LQKETQNKLYQVVTGVIPKNVLTKKNKAKSWVYGYNEKYNVIIISKTGQIGEIISISGLDIALPLAPEISRTRPKNPKEQYWSRTEYPKALQKIPSIFIWKVFWSSPPFSGSPFSL